MQISNNIFEKNLKKIIFYITLKQTRLLFVRNTNYCKKKPRLPMIIVTLGRNVHRPITITTTTHSKTSIVTK